VVPIGVPLILCVPQLLPDNHLHVYLCHQIAGLQFGEVSYVFNADGMRSASITGKLSLDKES
jgi:hypothetical protein